MAIKKVGTANPAEAYLVMPDAIFGSGQDGDVTISSNTTLTRDMNYNGLIINDTFTLNTGGYRVFCRKSLTMGGSSAILGLPGGSTATGTLGGGATGAVSNSLGGSGNSGVATAPTTGVGGSQYYQHPWNAVNAYALHASQTTPLVLRGGGGGSGATAGGGVVVVAARKIFGTGIIRANGATGGGGGVIVLVSNSSIPGSVATDVAGGTGGSAGTLLTFIAS